MTRLRLEKFIKLHKITKKKKQFKSPIQKKRHNTIAARTTIITPPRNKRVMRSYRPCMRIKCFGSQLSIDAGWGWGDVGALLALGEGAMPRRRVSVRESSNRTVRTRAPQTPRIIRHRYLSPVYPFNAAVDDKRCCFCCA